MANYDLILSNTTSIFPGLVCVGPPPPMFKHPTRHDTTSIFHYIHFTKDKFFNCFLFVFQCVGPPPPMFKHPTHYDTTSIFHYINFTKDKFFNCFLLVFQCVQAHLHQCLNILHVMTQLQYFTTLISRKTNFSTVFCLFFSVCRPTSTHV